MRKADRLFQITNLIRARAPITAHDIAEEMGLSVRTIYRYIDDLSVSGIPIYGTTGEGYRLSSDYELPPLRLNHEELEALMLGVQMVEHWTGETLACAAKSLLHKIESTQPLSAKQVATNLPIGVPGYQLDTETISRWEKLYRAIKQKFSVSIYYEDASNQLTQRELYPLGIFYWGGKWTLGAWCLLRNDYRTFRLDRMIEIWINSDHFLNENIYTKEAYIAAMTCSCDN